MCSVAKLCPTFHDPIDCQAPLSSTISLSLLKLMSIESVMPSNHLILCRLLLLLPSILPSIKVFSNESALYIRWPKYWSFSISPSSEYSGLISFRIVWFHLLAVQGTPTPQFKSINSSTLSLDSITLCLLSLSTHPQIKVSTKPSVCVWCVCMSLSHTCVLSHSVTKTLTFCNSKDWSLAGSSVPTLLKCIFPTIPLEYSSPFFSNVYCIKQSVNSIGKL